MCYRKRGFRVSTILLVLILLAIVVLPTQAKETVISLRLGHVCAGVMTHPYQFASVNFAELVSKKTNGKVKIEIYPAGQLGGDRAMFEAIQLGTLDMGAITASVIAGFTPILTGLELPWLFPPGNYDFLGKVVEGPIGMRLLDAMEQEVGVKGLAFWYCDFRHFAMRNKPIRSLEDLKGVKLRVVETPLHVDIFKSLGTSPTPVPFPDVYTALQMGTIDGFETNFTGHIAHRFYEVTDYISISGHFNMLPVMIINLKKFRSLPKEYQDALVEAAREVSPMARKMTERTEEECRKKLEEMGEKINVIESLGQFRQATSWVYDKYAAKHPLVKWFVEEVEKLKKQEGLTQ